MEKKKCKCGEMFNVPGNSTEMRVLNERGRLELLFAGVDVGIDKKRFLDGICPDCSKNGSLEVIDRFIQSGSNGKPVVDWAGIVREVNDEDFAYITRVLCRLRILSGDGEGNWIVMSQTHGCLNLMYGDFVNLYFTSPDDALEYAEAIRTVAPVIKMCHAMRVGHVFAI